MNQKELENKSRFLSLVLRHQPEKLLIKLDKEGWTDVNILLNKMNLTIDQLDWIVENNNKKRFSYNSDKTLIRANQGHTLNKIEIAYKKCLPNIGILYHGTSKELESIILKKGLNKMSRNHVHLSKEIETAKNVASRKSKNIIIFKVNAPKMIMDGISIYISDNGVYLTDNVPPEYITL